MDKKKFWAYVAIVVIGVATFVALWNLPVITGIVSGVIALLMPFIVGGAIAFILNMPMSFFERKIFMLEEKIASSGKKKKPQKAKERAKQGGTLERVGALLLSIAIVIAVIFIIIFVVVPEIGRTVKGIIDQVPQIAGKLVEWSEKYIGNGEEIAQWMKGSDIFTKDNLNKAMDYVGTHIGGLWDSTKGIVSGTISVLTNLFIGFIFAIYILLQKEKLGRQGKMILRAFLKEEHCNKLLEILGLTNKVFRSFLTGQVTEAVILGFMFLIVLSIFRIPYALLIAVLVTVTALIPIFGAFIACAVGAFLILFVNPIQAVWFIVIFLILQQVEGQLIYPHVVGKSVGLPAMWVLFAVTVGANLMGLLGMLIFIPLCSVLYVLFRTYVYKKQ
ncbi:MAG: AI-2E family transporter [Lachnospiraceae bacterium]|nr:AI-2E family transporter [Lachnospiraceae bacterium]